MYINSTIASNATQVALDTSAASKAAAQAYHETSSYFIVGFWGGYALFAFISLGYALWIILTSCFDLYCLVSLDKPIPRAKLHPYLNPNRQWTFNDMGYLSRKYDGELAGNAAAEKLGTVCYAPVTDSNEYGKHVFEERPMTRYTRDMSYKPQLFCEKVDDYQQYQQGRRSLGKVLFFTQWECFKKKKPTVVDEEKKIGISTC